MKKPITITEFARKGARRLAENQDVERRIEFSDPATVQRVTQ